MLMVALWRALASLLSAADPDSSGVRTTQKIKVQHALHRLFLQGQWHAKVARVNVRYPMITHGLIHAVSVPADHMDKQQ
jgi:hypothetical protein